MLAHEIGQIAHRLHRDRLVEQIHRLLALDAEAMPVGRAVRRERIEQLHPLHAAQTLAQRVDIDSEARKVLADAERLIGQHKEAGGWTLRRFRPEDLRQSHVLVQRFVIETRQQYRVAIGAAQRHRFGGKSGLAPLRLVAAEEIGLGGAFPGGGPGCLVEVDARHQ